MVTTVRMGLPLRGPCPSRTRRRTPQRCNTSCTSVHTSGPATSMTVPTGSRIPCAARPVLGGVDGFAPEHASRRDSNELAATPPHASTTPSHEVFDRRCAGRRPRGVRDARRTGESWRRRRGTVSKAQPTPRGCDVHRRYLSPTRPLCPWYDVPARPAAQRRGPRPSASHYGGPLMGRAWSPAHQRPT